MLIIVLCLSIEIILAYSGGQIYATCGSWAINAPLWLAGLAIIILMGINTLCSRILNYLRLLPQRSYHWLARRRQRQLNANSMTAYLALHTHAWAAAEQQLVRTAAANPSWHYLAATRAAYHQQAWTRCHHYLDQITARNSDLAVVIALWRSKIHSASGDYPAAVAALRIASTMAPRHPMLATLTLKLVKQAIPWPVVSTIATLIANNKIMPKHLSTTKSTMIYVKLITLAIHHQAAPAEILELWRNMHKKQRRNPRLVAAIMHILLQAPQQKQYWQIMAPDLLASAHKLMTQGYHAQLINAYSLLPEHNAAHLATITWCLDNYQATSTLLFAAGRIALNQQLWGQAKTYLHQALEHCASKHHHYKLALQIYLALARLHQELQEDEELKHCYQHITKLIASNAHFDFCCD